MELSLKARRVSFVVLLVIAIAALAAALYATFSARADASTWLIASVVVLVLALAGELVLLVFREPSKVDEGGDWYDWESQSKGEEILLRCPNCRETFTLLDTGERPLKHACPHCGRQGVLNDRPSAKGAARNA